MTSLLPARMLNELAYCPRLFHLEWVQREWDDSRYTADGKRVHRRVDRKTERASAKGKGESGPEPRVQRSVDVADETLGLVARINLTELEGSKVVPVDYKRGACPDVAEGAWEPERVQVAAQIMLLRAHGLDADHGELYFAESRRRVRVDLTPQLERRVLELRDQALEVAGEDKPPPPLEDDRKCRGCSLAGVCLPEETKLLTKASTRPIREVRARRVDAHPLHVTQPGSVIRKDGEELVVEPRDGDVQRVRLVEVSSVQLHGASKITTPALHALLRENIAVSYLSRGGWLYGRTRGPSHKNVLLRRAQYRRADDIEGSLRIAQRLVRAKIKNGRTLIRRNATVDSARAELTKTLETVDRAESIEALLGLEGHAAAVYFRAFNGLLGERVSPCFEFQRRNRRPAQDPTNALLSLGYALLTTTWTETVERVGFDPYLGFYHQPRYGKPALALDLMEEFRPIVADSVVLNLIRRGTLSEEDFVRTRTSCSLSKAGRRRFIGAYERRLSEEVTHPVFGYRVSYRQVFEIQARLLARYLTGETSDFPEFTTR